MSALDIYDRITIEALTLDNLHVWDGVHELDGCPTIGLAESHSLGVAWKAARLNEYVIGAYAYIDDEDTRWIVCLCRVDDIEGTVATHKMFWDAKLDAAHNNLLHVGVEQTPSHWLIASLEDEGFRLTSQTWKKSTRRARP